MPAKPCFSTLFQLPGCTLTRLGDMSKEVHINPGHRGSSLEPILWARIEDVNLTFSSGQNAAYSVITKTSGMPNLRRFQGI